MSKSLLTHTDSNITWNNHSSKGYHVTRVVTTLIKRSWLGQQTDFKNPFMHCRPTKRRSIIYSIYFEGFKIIPSPLQYDAISLLLPELKLFFFVTHIITFFLIVLYFSNLYLNLYVLSSRHYICAKKLAIKFLLNLLLDCFNLSEI